MDSETIYFPTQSPGVPYGTVSYSNFSNPGATWTSVGSSATGTGNYGVTYSSGSLTFNIPGIYIVTASLTLISGTTNDVKSVGFSVNGSFSNSNICQSSYMTYAAAFGQYYTISGSVCQGYATGSVIHTYAWTQTAATIQCSLAAALLTS